MATAVKRIDRGFQAAVERTSALAGSGVKVGYQADSGSEDGVDILDIAIWNEFGTEHIPSRPFMRDSAVKYEHDVGLIMGHLAKKVQNGQATQQLALETLGAAHQAHIAAHIRSGEFEPNAPSTIERKGSTVPLVDQGRVLVPGLRYEVLKGQARRSWIKRLLRIGK